jgi:type IV pilus assembly protein PilC
MAKFDYEALDIQGKLIKGQLEAVSKEEALNELKENRLYVKSINKKLEMKLKSKINSKIKSQFFYKLYNIMGSGVTLIRGLELISLQVKNKAFEVIIKDILKNLQEGESLSDSLEKHNKVFSNMVIQQIRAGELGANIEEVLLDIHNQYETESKLRGSILGALMYPAMIALLGVVILGVMILKVIPTLEEAFVSIDATLPAITVFILGITSNIIPYLIGLVTTGIALLLGFIYIRKNEDLSYKFDKFTLKIPILGTGIYYFQSYIFFKILGSLISIGMPVTEVFNVLENTIRNKYILRGVMQSKESIERDGLSLSEVLTKSGIFHEEFVQLILIGEESGSLPEMLEFLAKQSQEELDNVLKKVTNLVGPIILSVVLSAVGVILISMMLPIFSLIDQI